MKIYARLAGLLTLVFSLSAAATELPPELQGLGLREADVASRDLPGWKKPQRILVWAPFGPQLLDELKIAAPGVELVAVGNAEEALLSVVDIQRGY